MALSAQWSTRFGFIMASVGFAVGLGNIWRFPYVTGENGGAVFVITYLLCVVLIGVPVLMAELMLGRYGGGSPMGSLARVAQQQNRSPQWRWVGGLNLLTAFLIQVVYCVIAGWVLFYLYQALTGGFSGVTPERSLEAYEGLLQDVRGLWLWTALSLIATGAIVFFGVERGIERAVRVLLPTLFVLMLVLAVYNLFNGGFGAALRYLFTPDMSKLDAPLVLAAVGQAFFSIGVAMAGMMTFGAYLPKDVSITRSAWLIVTCDTAVALLAGLVIFPVVFAHSMDPAGGAGLIFQSLPVAFANIPFGSFVGALFFLLLSVAAVTSMVGLVEPLIAWCEEQLELSRPLAVVLVLSLCWICSGVSVFSYNAWAHWSIAERSLAAWLDFVPNQIFLPLGGLLIALFAGWFVKPRSSSRELALQGPAFTAWHLALRFLVPVAIAAIFVTGLGSG